MPDKFANLLPTLETAFLERMHNYAFDGLPCFNRRYVPYKIAVANQRGQTLVYPRPHEAKSDA